MSCRSKAVLWLQFFFVCVSVVSCAAFVLSLFIPHLDFAAARGLYFVIAAFPGHIHLYGYPYCNVMAVTHRQLSSKQISCHLFTDKESNNFLRYSCSASS